MTTNVPPIQITNAGVIVPSDQAVLAGVIADLQQAFGGALNLSATDMATLSTPQGQLATSWAAIISSVYATFLYQSTQTDPAYAQGRWQDAIARLYFLERNPAEPTSVQAICTGDANVIIPAGSLAQAEDGTIYASTADATIPIGGSVTVTFQSIATGPIACPANSLNTIYQAVSGWDTVNNPADGVLGNDTESRSQFEERRAASVASNALGTVPSMLGAVLAVPNVLDAFVTENDLGSPVTTRGAVLVANSVYVAVVGGDPTAVATAIWKNKQPGCAYNGNTTVTITDQSAGLAPPFPTYNVTFEVPPGLPILFAVSIANGPNVPSNAAALVRAAIISAFAGGDGGARAKIGATIYASRFVAPIAALGSWAIVVGITIGSTNNSDAATFGGSIVGTALTLHGVSVGAVAIGQTVSDALGLIPPGVTILSGSGNSWVISQAVTSPSVCSFTATGSSTNLTVSAVGSGKLAAGDFVTGSGVPANTTIISQTSGAAGGTGVYVTSHPTTSVGAALTAYEAMAGATADQNDVVVNINQVPTIDAANIAVTVV